MTHADVLVIGAGPAGIAAATAAAEHGRKVFLLDDNAVAGGQIWRAGTLTRSKPTSGGGNAKRQALARLARSGTTLLGQRRIFAAHREGFVQVLHENGGTGAVETFSFERLILATGARERFLPFPGWTLPGVYGAGGLQALVTSGLPIAGKRIVVAGTGPLLLAVAAHLREDGATVPLIAEQASRGRLAHFSATLFTQPAKLLQGASYRARLWRSKYKLGCWVTEALPTQDGQALRAVRLTNGSQAWEEPCDLLACGYHLVPNTEIAALLGCAFDGLQVKVNHQQQTSLGSIYCVGEPTGIAGLDAARVQGRIAGLAAAGQSTQKLQSRAASERRFGVRLNQAFALRPELASLAHANTIVCRCEDVSFEQLKPFRSWTEAKLQTRCGMGACQGRVCGPAVDVLFRWKAHSVRQPLFPVPLEAFCTQTEAIPSTKENA